MKIAELNKIFTEQLESLYSLNEINSIFAILAGHFLSYSRKDILLKEDQVVKDEITFQFMTALAELKKYRPVQYITGEAEFYGLKLAVNEKVLIPRPETEELVDWILSDIKNIQRQKRELKILDIGTGSGCIAIALKKSLQDSEVLAMDISEEALGVAKENARKNRTDIKFLKADILHNEGLFPSGQFSILVSNPPYVRPSEKETMGKNVLDYEPHLALFAPEENALIYYKAIITFAASHLEKNGQIYAEINQGLAEQVRILFADAGFSDVIVKKDLSGNDRMVRASKNDKNSEV